MNKLVLLLSVLISMFTAITITRTFLRAVQEVWLRGTSPEAQPRIRWLFGLHADEAPRGVAGTRVPSPSGRGLG